MKHFIRGEKQHGGGFGDIYCTFAPSQGLDGDAAKWLKL